MTLRQNFSAALLFGSFDFATASPSRTVGIQLLNPHDTPVSVMIMPGVDYSSKPIPGISWLDDTSTFPGSRLPDGLPLNGNWNSMKWIGAWGADGVDLRGHAGMHGVMEFHCDELPYFNFSQVDPYIDVRHEFDYDCRNTNECGDVVFQYHNQDFCLQCKNCHRPSFAERGTSVRIHFDCSTDIFRVEEMSGSKYMWSVNSVTNDWLVLELKDFIGAGGENCPAECGTQCRNFAEWWPPAISRGPLAHAGTNHVVV